jgi:hypothetical protein
LLGDHRRDASRSSGSANAGWFGNHHLDDQRRDEQLRTFSYREQKANSGYHRTNVAMSKANEEEAVWDAFEQQIRLMYAVLLEALVQDNANANVNEACQRFRKGLGLARKARDLAKNMISE